ncbi:hypothetical protein ARGLB_028_00270 [Arthrobacter globiformis NBRC 12137]|uniref:Uncharacterized protein n=1 Tax=Arthrobacter globiformis (strain ATCC 8010 / DSM 20124 / JCM 1332 / NBRC 12137 / NCIMB 8907 / NRRL B-2979 / 168) TaxID=1077972 RepID=H0QJA1_ARTG1|nr:hypothetical protein ARGLB_028_00270 [Arthrobacter globiformis NBRC 12137]
MHRINLCRWLTFQRTRRYYGWNLAERLKSSSLREELREWSLRDNELAVMEWAFAWLTIAGVAVIPVTWALLQWAPWLIPTITVVGLIGPVAGVLCAFEIYGRWLIGRWFPSSPARLPGGPSIIEGNSLLASSLATYALIPVLYIFLDAVVLPAAV